MAYHDEEKTEYATESNKEIVRRVLTEFKERLDMARIRYEKEGEVYRMAERDLGDATRNFETLSQLYASYDVAKSSADDPSSFYQSIQRR